MDVETAFLNGKVEEDICMQQPERYIEPNKEHSDLQAKCSIYGLKPASQCWNKALDDHIECIGFGRSASDNYVYI